jgi:hypothetical protein
LLRTAIANKDVMAAKPVPLCQAERRQSISSRLGISTLARIHSGTCRLRQSVGSRALRTTLAIVLVFGAPSHSLAAVATATPAAPAVINLSVVNVERVAKLLRSLYPRARITCDPSSNAIVVVASADDVNGMRTVASGIDVKGPRATTIDTVQLHNAASRDVLPRLAHLFPAAHFLSVPNQTLVVSASATDVPQIKAVIAAIDAPVASAPPKPVYPSEVLHVTQTGAKRVATALSEAA